MGLQPALHSPNDLELLQANRELEQRVAVQLGRQAGGIGAASPASAASTAQIEALEVSLSAKTEETARLEGDMASLNAKAAAYEKAAGEELAAVRRQLTAAIEGLTNLKNKTSTPGCRTKRKEN